MNILVESMTKLRLAGIYNVRIWMQQSEDDYKELDRTTLEQEVNKRWLSRLSGCPSTRELAEDLLLIKNVNAVEVTFDNGNGSVLYKNWP